MGFTKIIKSEFHGVTPYDPGKMLPPTCHLPYVLCHVWYSASLKSKSTTCQSLLAFKRSL